MQWKKRKIVRGIILAVLLVCTVFLTYSIVTDPLGEHDIMLPLLLPPDLLHYGRTSEKKDNFKFVEFKNLI